MGKQEIVIASAKQLFEKYGYKKMTMDELSRVSGVTKKTIYSYFENKQALFSYLVEEELHKMKEEIEKMKKEMSFAKLIENFISKLIQFRNEKQIIRNIINEARYDEVVNQNLKKLDHDVINYIEKQIIEGIECGELKECDTHLAAFIVYRLSEAIAIDYCEELESEEVATQITKMLKTGILN